MFLYKNNIMKVLVEAILVCFFLKHVLTLDCYWNACKYKYFSSKTPYENVRGDIRDSIVKSKGCQPISVWAILRHGKRNPSVHYSNYIKDILMYKDFIISSYEIGNSTLCAQDIENIRNWKIDTSFINKPVEIANEGYQELVGIGKRIKESFPELLEELTEEDYLFVPAFGQRMQQSAKAFVEGLNNKELFIEQYRNEFNFMAPYSRCGKYYVEVINNSVTYHQEMEYLETEDYLNMKERVEKKLGLNFTISNKDIIGMYDLCRYTWDGINNKPSPWCAPFSVDDLEVLEYIGDLTHYYRNGYAISQYSKVLGQMPLADLFRNFENAKTGNGKKIMSYFTHATMMDMILVALNLFKDVNPLMGAHRDINRKWRTSFTSSFGTNLIAFLNRCKNQEENAYDYKIAFYWNEKPLLELCEDGVCSWNEFEDMFKQFLNATTDFCEFITPFYR